MARRAKLSIKARPPASPRQKARPPARLCATKWADVGGCPLNGFVGATWPAGRLKPQIDLRVSLATDQRLTGDRRTCRAGARLSKPTRRASLVEWLAGNKSAPVWSLQLAGWSLRSAAVGARECFSNGRAIMTSTGAIDRAPRVDCGARKDRAKAAAPADNNEIRRAYPAQTRRTVALANGFASPAPVAFNKNGRK